MILRILICFFFALTILSCTKQLEEDTPIITDNVNEENVSEVDSKDFSIKNNPIEIGDATSLVVLDDKTTSSTSGKAENLFLQSNLFKVSSSGQTENLSLFSLDIDDQDYSENILVEKIHLLNDKYIVLEGTFSISFKNEVVIEYSKILVRKTDGALFSFEMFPSNAKKGPNGESPFQSDAEGNIYYLNGNMVYKMDTSDPEKITIEEYLSSGQSASYFSVDSMGNCIYSDDFLNTKIRKKNGGILLLESLTDKTVYNYWKGRDGNIHLLTNHGGSTNLDSTTGISSIISNNDELEIVLLWEGNTEETVAIELNMGTYQYILDQDENGIYFFGYGNESWRFNELSKTVDIIEVPDNSYPILSSFNQYSLKSYSNKYIYLAKGTDLYEIDLADLSFRTLLDNGYEMYNILLLENGHIQISALRYNDGIKILGELDLNGNFTILNENENKEAIALIRLN
tara:strand:+ start:454 stop:1824 length:1371 start_codon:yes stop_codon:yes gene_type:complete